MMSTGRLISKAAGSHSASAFLSSTRRNMAQSTRNKYTEVEIKVPWGKIAGKLWNPNETQPILALHGWQDNAASYDNLIPLLPQNTSVLAIDLPGHGLSSWLPKGTFYSRLMYAQIIRRIKDQLNWQKIGLIGHSLGGMICFTYTALFPEDVKFVTALDYFKYPVANVNDQTIKTAEELRNFLDLEKSDKLTRSFREEETIAKLIEVTENSLNESTCRILMSRGVTKNADGTVYLNRDPAVKLLSLTALFTNEHMMEKARRIKAPYLIVKADDWGYYGDKDDYFDCMGVIERGSVDFRYFVVPGKHHFHMMNPEPVAELMIPFLEKYN